MTRGGLLAGAIFCLVLGAVDLGVLNVRLVPAVWPPEPVGVVSARPDSSISHPGATVARPSPDARTEAGETPVPTTGPDVLSGSAAAVVGTPASMDEVPAIVRTPVAEVQAVGGEVGAPLAGTSGAPVAPGAPSDTVAASKSGAETAVKHVDMMQVVHFDTGQAELSQEVKTVLDGLVTMLKKDLELTATVEGHTDQTGDPASNQELSAQRAESVVSYLTSQGIESARINARSFGDTRPVAIGTDLAALEKNRRVEIRIRKGTP